MTTDPYVLAVDQGSSGTKVAVFDGAGTLLAHAARRTVVAHPEVVAAEADPRTWWDALVEAVRQVLETVPAERIGAVGFTGFMHTVVPATANGDVAGPTLLWPDQRPLADADGKHHPGVERVRWSRREDPAAAVRWYLPVKDYLRFRLTGTARTDHYEAGGTGFLDRPGGDWSAEAAGYAGVDIGAFPALGAPTDLAGTVTPEAARATGLRAGTAVVTGTGDWMATLLGANAVLPARACVYLGTAGVAGGFASPAAAAALTEPVCFAAATATGSAVDWSAGLLGVAGAADLAARAAQAPAGARGVTFLPHLMGERGNGSRPHARGALLGLTLAHTQADVARAVLEGTALWLRAIAGDDLAARDPAEIVAVGGGARSEVWLRILAAVLGRDLAVPAVTEAALLGAALIAARGTGMPADPGEWVRTARTVPAEPELVKTYAARFDEFRAIERRFAGAEG